MLTVLKGMSRRHNVLGGNDRWMSFDPEARIGPFHDGFRSLKGFDEVRVAPGSGDPPSTRANVELLTYVLDGVLLYKNDLGQSGILLSGDFQHMSKGTGIRHSRSNGSPLDPAHVFECRIGPDRQGLAPRCAQMRFSSANRRGIFCLVASPDPVRSSFRINQDVRVYSSLPDRGSHLIHGIEAGRQAWLHVVTGGIQLGGLELVAGDGVAFQDEVSVSITALVPSELLLFDLA